MALLALLLLVSVARAGDAPPDRIKVLVEAPPPPHPFREMTLGAAKAAAKKAGKLLFLNTVTDRCPPCVRMHRTTFKDPAFLSWLERKALAVEIHAARNMKDIRRLRAGSFPTIVLFDARGRELTRLDGFLETDALLRALEEGVAGRSNLDATREAAENSQEGEARAKARYEHALQLMGAGKDVEATKLVVALYTREMKPYPALHGYRTFLLMNFVKVAERHPPAAGELERLRAEAAARLTRDPKEEDAEDLVWYDRARRKEDDALALYDSWPAGDPRRRVLGRHVINSLRGNKRWAEALELEEIKDHVADLRAQLRAAESDRERENIVRMSSVRVLGLAQGKRDTDARKLIAAMFEADSSTTTRADVKQTLDLLGRADLLPAR